jgi:hypothetical protein
MTIDEIDRLISRWGTVGQAGHAKQQFHLDCRGVDFLECDDRRRLFVKISLAQPVQQDTAEAEQRGHAGEA